MRDISPRWMIPGAWEPEPEGHLTSEFERSWVDALFTEALDLLPQRNLRTVNLARTEAEKGLALRWRLHDSRLGG